MRIALVSDTHLAARAAVCLDNWRVVRAWIERARPDLVVHLGDITVDGASDAVELRDAVDAFAGLDVPIRFLPGNHDIGDNPVAPCGRLAAHRAQRTASGDGNIRGGAAVRLARARDRPRHGSARPDAAQA